ncbi:hypothetical protein [Kitasatospora sp. NPDC015120]|uniref:hypothetical protein n=1 Tax=Kitasatospora sp. NPDC015120 TaxID=3364023 RepID=UPI0036F48E17
MMMARRNAGNELSGLDIALEWGKLPPEHLTAALKALEPELKRAHELRMKRADMEEQERISAREAEERHAQRSYRLYMTGLAAGFTLCAGMLVGSVIEAINGQAVLAVTLAGPTMLGVASLFVLRQRSAGQGRRASGRAPAVPGQQASPAVVPNAQPLEPLP